MYWPVQTSYFSITTFVSSDMNIRTAIVIDIMKKYFDYLKQNGDNLEVITIQGYGSFITFDDLCFAIHYVFNKLYGDYPSEENTIFGNAMIGWNREVTNPSIDIPFALKLYEQLSSPAVSYTDKWDRMQNIEKLFYKYYDPNNPQMFFTSDTIIWNNENFKNWIDTKIKEINDSLALHNSFDNLYVDEKKYVFDLKPNPSTFDDMYKASGIEIELKNFNNAIIVANKFYMSFLGAMEQLLYTYTRQIFPFKLYANIGHLFHVYLRSIVEFFKPWHAKLLEPSPILKFGDDIYNSVTVGTEYKTRIKKQIVESVLNNIFDDTQASHISYDEMRKIREDVIITINEL